MPRITNLDEERFTFGDCHILARRLHMETGWPMYAFDDGDGNPDHHVFVLAPNGQALDVYGLRDVAKAKLGWWEGDAIIRTDWAQLRKEWDVGVYGDYSFTRARVVARILVQREDVQTLLDQSLVSA